MNCGSSLLAFALLISPLGALAVEVAPRTFDQAQFEGMQWRVVGPFRGGRSDAVQGIATQPHTYYFGATGGGVWKTTDGGHTWRNVSDGFFGGSIGSVAVSESDPNVIYVGTGEKTVRNDASYGDGVWKSLDAGKTWTNVGLKDSRHISRIRIHPGNPDLVYAAVMGHLFGPNSQRGVYRSKDGGKTWERILFANENAGAVDLIMDHNNPRILFASTWRVRRTQYSFESGGDGSALWKSTDGGDSWKNISTNPGLPKGPTGIAGVAVSPSNSENVYAIVEAAEGGVFRSRNGGETWERTNDSDDLRQRAWYYTRIFADPKDEDVVYVLNFRFQQSKDGGKTFTAVVNPHGDNHDLWIAPNDPKRMIEANDGGASVSYDGGRSWSAQDNQPTGQFYRVSTDNSFPYRLLGGQQDGTALRIRHATTGDGIGPEDCEDTAGGESGHVVAKPDDPDVVFGSNYGGYLAMYNHRTEERRRVDPWPDNPVGAGVEEAPERFAWNFPVLFSQHDPDVLYAASQHLWRSTDGGGSWTRISGDLTRDDKSKMGSSGGPITKDNTSAEYYGTILVVAGSPLEGDLLWIGSDDGLIHVSRDAGRSWKAVTPKEAPTWIMWNSIDPSPFDTGTAYVAGTLYKSDDFHPYLYKTTDYGETWKKITNGIPQDEFARVVRSDKRRKGLLYSGTERGVYVSFDDGASWQPLQLNLPVAPIADLAVRDDDLIAATHGRAFWILDDLSPLQQWEGSATKDVKLFTPRTTWRMAATERHPGADDDPKPPNRGTNAPEGIIVSYWIDRSVAPGTKVKLAMLNADGSMIREFQGDLRADAKRALAADAGKAIQGTAAEKEEQNSKLPGSHYGLNRFAWNLRYPAAKAFEGLILWGEGGMYGPRVPPGTYALRLTAGDVSRTTTVHLIQDPRTRASSADLQRQFDFLLASNRKLSQVHEEIASIRDVLEQIGQLRKRIGNDEKSRAVTDAAEQLARRVTTIEKTLYQTQNRSPHDPLNFPIRLNNKLAELTSSVAVGDHVPTAQQLAYQSELVGEIDAALIELAEIRDKDLPAFNRMAQQSAVPAIQLEAAVE